MNREPVQLVEFVMPRCANTFGVSPCTATAEPGQKCFNTRATCADPDNYRQSPEGRLATADVYYTGNTVPASIFDRTATLFAAFDVAIPEDPAGIIWEQGTALLGLYFGFDSGNLVLHAGGTGASFYALAQADASSLAGKSLTLFIEVDMTAESVAVWSYDATERTVSQFMTATSAGTIGSGFWSGDADGGIGTKVGTAIGGYDTSDFNGVVYQARFYDSTEAPNMDGPFVQSIFFSRGNVADRDVVPYAYPFLKSVSTQGAQINPSGAENTQTGLGIRAACSISFGNGPSSDRNIDPYRGERLYDPLKQGTFWGKFLARYPYRNNILMRVHDGYAGQTLAEMQKRAFIMTKIDGPANGGGTTVSGKDVLTYIEAKKAKVPPASPGVLHLDIDAEDTSFEVARAVGADYPSSGVIRINAELISYSAIADSANGAEFTVAERGYDGTEAVEHNAGDGVQECLPFDNVKPVDVLRDLMVRYGGLPYQYFDYVTMRDDMDEYLPFIKLTSTLSEPEEVVKLVPQIMEQCALYLWWDERGPKVTGRAVYGQTEDLDTISEEENILAGSFTLMEKPEKRVSQVWYYYGRRSAVADDDDTSNYTAPLVTTDLPSESPERNATPSVREIKSKWVIRSGDAQTASSRILRQYAEIPKQCKFRLDAKDRQYWIGDQLHISHGQLEDKFGARIISTWTILSAREVVTGEVIEYLAEDTSAYGIVYQILGDDQPDYQGDGSDPKYGAFIGDDDGLLSDGTPCATIG